MLQCCKICPFYGFQENNSITKKKLKKKSWIVRSGQYFNVSHKKKEKRKKKARFVETTDFVFTSVSVWSNKHTKFVTLTLLNTKFTAHFYGNLINIFDVLIISIAFQVLCFKSIIFSTNSFHFNRCELYWYIF